MVYWYIPYVVHAAYPPGTRQFIAPIAAASDMIAMPPETSPYPPVQTTRFHHSARTTIDMMKQVELLISKVAESDEFARELMMSAQASNQKRVDELVASTGITAKVQTTYTPDGIRLHIQSTGQDGICCDLLLKLLW